MLRVVHAGVSRANKLCLIGLAVLLCVGAYGLSLPQEAELGKLHKKLESKQQQALVVEAERDQLRQEVLLLNSDPDYLEIIARDRNDLFREGETVFRIEREPSRRAIEVE